MQFYIANFSNLIYLPNYETSFFDQLSKTFSRQVSYNLQLLGLVCLALRKPEYRQLGTEAKFHKKLKSSVMSSDSPANLASRSSARTCNSFMIWALYQGVFTYLFNSTYVIDNLIHALLTIWPVYAVGVVFHLAESIHPLSDLTSMESTGLFWNGLLDSLENAAAIIANYMRPFELSHLR